MTAAPRLELRQSQSLVMTQQLQQSIKLLQMNAQELTTFVEQQLEENPFLAAEDAEAKEDGPVDSYQDAAPLTQETAPEAPQNDESFMPEEWQEAPAFDAGESLRMHVTARNSDGEELDFHDSQVREITLREHLLEQLQMTVADPIIRRIGMHLIDLVDEAGYIKDDLATLSDQLGADPEHIHVALAIVQRFEPSGVGARNLQECLALQLRDLDRLDPAMQKLLEHLHLLADGNMPALQRLCAVDGEDLKQMIAEIRALNPKPGLAFTHEIVETVEPDVTIRREATGKWHVELNSSALPRVLVNRRYFSKVSTHATGMDKKYITERLHEANWLIKALDQRAHTILKVATEIVVQQEGFFRMGIHHLKPLTLKDIARETGFHESTVSRVTSGKYMVTPRGVFEFKYFFTSGLSHGAGGEDVSSETVKYMIKELIEKEDNKSVLSDDDLADRLKEKNINVARRTVAKYREALGIPSSMHRRRLKASIG